MKKLELKFLLSLLLLAVMISPNFAQDSRKQIIFAVSEGGKWLEPIVQVEDGKLVEVQSDANNSWENFIKTYYQPKTTYNLIFGGSPSGKVTVLKAEQSECSPNFAETSLQSPRVKLGGMVMALATNAKTKKTTGLRRAPTAAERTEIEKLVRTEFTKQENSAAVLKTLRSHNLTALDVDGDGKAEFIGTYWVTPSKSSRGFLFFIAEKAKNGKYVFSHSEYESIKDDGVMSGDVKDLDGGIYHELLLDAFDYDGDGTSEIFTIVQAFEGNNFHIYRRENGKWTKAFETYNYRCGY